MVRSENDAIVEIIFNKKKLPLYVENHGYPDRLGAKLAVQLRKILKELTSDPINGIQNIKVITPEQRLTKDYERVEQAIKERQCLDSIMYLAGYSRTKTEDMLLNSESFDTSGTIDHLSEDVLISLKSHFENLKVVSIGENNVYQGKYSSILPTKEEIESLKKYSNFIANGLHLSNWHTLLRNCQSNLIYILQSGYVLISSDEAKYKYTIDLDENKFYYNGRFVETVTDLSPYEDIFIQN